MSAISRADAKGDKYLEPTRFLNDQTWSGVGQIKTLGSIKGTGTLISPCHVLTAAHVFFPAAGGIFGDKRGGIGDKPKPGNSIFDLVVGEAPEKLVRKNFQVADIQLGPGYKYDKDPKVKDAGHRIVPPTDPGDTLTRNDIAIIRLTQRVPKAIRAADKDVPIIIYNVNMGDVALENDPTMTIPNAGTANAVKVGFGQAGDGKVAADGMDFKREMFNIIDDFGNGKDVFATMNVNRPYPPPKNTLVYDFDDPAQPTTNASNLKNTFRAGKPADSFAVGTLEGSPGPGDSGGPMFQNRGGTWYIVGVTSSGTDGQSRFGTVAYDTQVQKYKDWISGVVKDFKDPPDCPKAKESQDWGDAPQSRGYPTKGFANGARHLDFRSEWLGSTRDPEPSASFELEADDPMDEDGEPNLVNRDHFDDGVILPPRIIPGQPFQITVRIGAMIDAFGFGSNGRYDRNDPRKRLYLNAWADWQDNGSWHDSGDKIIGMGSLIGTVAIDPETFGPDGRYTVGEPFEDVGEDGIPGTGDFGEGDGVHEDGEPFTDIAGQRYADFVFTVVAPPDAPPVVYFRFRLDYGEDVGNLHNPASDPLLQEDQGPASFGEVEDYVVENIPPVCWLASIESGPPLTATIMMQDAESGLGRIETLDVTNLAVHIPIFEMGDRTPIPVDVTLLDQNASGQVTWRMTDVAGNQSLCDPEKATVVRHKGEPTPTILTGISQSERHVRIINGDPGLRHLRLEVNERQIAVLHLAAGEVLTIDIGSALRPGTNNTVSVTPLGAPGGSATVIVSE